MACLKVIPTLPACPPSGIENASSDQRRIDHRAGQTEMKRVTTSLYAAGGWFKGPIRKSGGSIGKYKHRKLNNISVSCCSLSVIDFNIFTYILVHIVFTNNQMEEAWTASYGRPIMIGVPTLEYQNAAIPLFRDAARKYLTAPARSLRRGCYYKEMNAITDRVAAAIVDMGEERRPRHVHAKLAAICNDLLWHPKSRGHRGLHQSALYPSRNRISSQRRGH